ncbi:hypothetical protein Q1695_006425 [Nippostrongylus brasiliensis]|nr:hypothetical protein Q1695_006425 [Nippostrongylus brasiliensis]
MKNLDCDVKGYPVDGKRINHLRFSDDIVLISNSTAEAEEMLSEFNMACKKIGLRHEYIQNAICGQPVRTRAGHGERPGPSNCLQEMSSMGSLQFDTRSHRSGRRRLCMQQLTSAQLCQ